MKSTRTLLGAAAVSLFALSGVAQAADVVIGVPNWPSVRVTGHVLKVVLEDNFGLEVEMQNGTNPVVFEAMDSGAMHVHPEVWLPNQVQASPRSSSMIKAPFSKNPEWRTKPSRACASPRARQKRTGITEIFPT